MLSVRSVNLDGRFIRRQTGCFVFLPHDETCWARTASTPTPSELYAGTFIFQRSGFECFATLSHLNLKIVPIAAWAIRAGVADVYGYSYRVTTKSVVPFGLLGAVICHMLACGFDSLCIGREQLNGINLRAGFRNRKTLAACRCASSNPLRKFLNRCPSDPKLSPTSRTNRRQPIFCDQTANRGQRGSRGSQSAVFKMARAGKARWAKVRAAKKECLAVKKPQVILLFRLEHKV